MKHRQRFRPARLRHVPQGLWRDLYREGRDLLPGIEREMTGEEIAAIMAWLRQAGPFPPRCDAAVECILAAWNARHGGSL